MKNRFSTFAFNCNLRPSTKAHSDAAEEMTRGLNLADGERLEQLNIARQYSYASTSPTPGTGAALQLDSIKTHVESAFGHLWFQSLKLKHDKLLSSFAFNCNRVSPLRTGTGSGRSSHTAESGVG